MRVLDEVRAEVEELREELDDRLAQIARSLRAVTEEANDRETPRSSGPHSVKVEEVDWLDRQESASFLIEPVVVLHP